MTATHLHTHINAHVQEKEDARLHTSRSASVSSLENISNTIHLQSHYYGSVIIRNRIAEDSDHFLLSHGGEFSFLSVRPSEHSSW